MPAPSTVGQSYGAPPAPPGEDVSLLAVGAALLRWRRRIVVLGIVGGIVGLATGLLSTRMYLSGATFIPEGAESGASGLALAASQFGIRMPASGSAWGPPVYVELLRSRALLEPILANTSVERGGRQVPLMELLNIKATNPAERVETGVLRLRRYIRAGEVKSLNAVRLSVITPWPDLSYSIARQLVDGVNRFNLETRKSQGGAERQFVEKQAAEAESQLRAAEERLERFQKANRIISSSPELQMERDRLERHVNMRVQVYTSLLQSREEARIREVRDTPVITLLDEPRAPASGEGRRTVLKGVIGGFIGVALGALLALLGAGLSRARVSGSGDTEEFFNLIDEVKPRFLQRRV